ncbi:hypothetical protein BJX76DRAFT_334628 [Aspergillus varians]
MLRGHTITCPGNAAPERQIQLQIFNINNASQCQAPSAPTPYSQLLRNIPRQPDGCTVVQIVNLRNARILNY